MEYEDGLRELSDSMKYSNIHIIGVQEEEESTEGAEVLFQKIRAENSLIWEREQTPRSRRHRKPPTKSTEGNPHQDTVIKMAKSADKERI